MTMEKTATRPNQPPLKRQRRWDELRRFGADLTTHPHSNLSARIDEVARFFEVPDSVEAEAVRNALTGLRHAVEAIEELADHD
jgi:hypothetical protein